MENIGLNKCKNDDCIFQSGRKFYEGMSELFEYILIALACPLALPFINLQESEDQGE